MIGFMIEYMTGLMRIYKADSYDRNHDTIHARLIMAYMILIVYMTRFMAVYAQELWQNTTKDSWQHTQHNSRLRGYMAEYTRES